MNQRVLLIVFLMFTLQACGSSPYVATNRGLDRQTTENAGAPIGNYPTPEVSPSHDSEGTFKDGYKNAEYGYELVIPSGLVGKNSPPPADQNGFRIELPGTDNDSISVYAEYNPLFFKDDEAAFLNEINNIRRDDPQFKLVKKQRVFLGDESAIRFRAEYLAKASAKPRIVDEIIGLRKCSHVDSKIVYVVSMDTSEAGYEQRSIIFSRLVGSWRMLQC